MEPEQIWAVRWSYESVERVYVWQNNNSVYRTDADGGNLRQIGQIPRE